jgi:hypothetical protein
VAPPMPNQLVSITSEQHDDRHRVDWPAAAVTDASLSVHASIIGTEETALQFPASDHRYSPPCSASGVTLRCGFCEEPRALVLALVECLLRGPNPRRAPLDPRPRSSLAND